MSGDQETTTENPEDESSQTTIEDTKTELATMYLNFLDKQKWGILATTAWLGVNLNPLQKDAVEYLTTDAVVKEKTDFFSNIGKNIKKKFVEKFTGWTMLEYDKASLSKMKALITQYKNDQTKLQGLMDQIAAGTDPTATETPPTPVEQTTNPPVASTPETKVDVKTSALIGWSLVVISQSDINLLTSEKEKIKPEIKWDFAAIKEVKNSQGKIILEWTGETPYIHKDVRPDLLTLACIFYQKTGQALSISSAFRTYTNQEKLKKEDKENAATPGYSGHETWRSFDVKADNDRYSEKIWGIKWFQEIAKKCHFNPLPWEDWHFDHESLPKAEDRPAIATALDKEYQEKFA